MKERTKVDIREEMALRAIDERWSVSEVAKMFDVSRPTVRLWRDRYRAEGRAGLEDRSHAVKNCPHATDPEIVKAIVAKREKYGWGSKKILKLLEREHPELDLPARSTTDGILSRHDLVRKQRRSSSERQSPFQRPYEPTETGELFTIDFKGEFRLGNGRYCFPLTMTERLSRYILTCEALPSTSLDGVWKVLKRTFREYGLPQAIQSDNGPPFGATNGTFSTLGVRLMSYGVAPIYSRPGRPQDNGQHERMHRDLKREATRPSSQGMRSQQKRFDEFRTRFNEQRPHEALEMKFPVELFDGTKRSFPAKQPTPNYPESFEKRKIDGNGFFKWNSQPVFLSSAFIGHTLGFEAIDEGLWAVSFHRFVVGKFDEKEGRFL